jgi:hypothetical protein
MAIFNGSFKLLATSFGVGSVLVIKGFVSDVNLYSNKFMNDNEIKPAIATEKVVTEVAKSVALPVSNQPKIQFLSMSDANKKKLEGEWEITVITESIGGKDEVVYNKHQRSADRSKMIKVNFEQIDTSIVRIDGDDLSTYKVSYLTEYNTIALFKEIDGGYEIIEGRKIRKSALDSLKTSTRVVSRSNNNEEDHLAQPAIPEVGDFFLIDALNPIKSSDRLTAAKDQVSGSVTVGEQNISSLSVTLHRGTNKEVSLSISEIEINDGGQISAEYEGESIAGIITANGKGAKTIRFATGPLQGATLNFVSQDKWDHIREQQEIARLAREESEQSNIAREVAAISKQDEGQRRNAAREELEDSEEELEEELEEEVEELESEEEITKKFEESGFSFGGEATTVALK